jgi:hypothetical protein
MNALDAEWSRMYATAGNIESLGRQQKHQLVLCQAFLECRRQWCNEDARLKRDAEDTERSLEEQRQVSVRNIESVLDDTRMSREEQWSSERTAWTDKCRADLVTKHHKEKTELQSSQARLKEAWTLKQRQMDVDRTMAALVAGDAEQTIQERLQQRRALERQALLDARRANGKALFEAKHAKKKVELQAKHGTEEAAMQVKISQELGRRAQTNETARETMERQRVTETRRCHTRYDRMLAAHKKLMKKRATSTVKNRLQDTDAFVRACTSP